MEHFSLKTLLLFLISLHLTFSVSGQINFSGDIPEGWTILSSEINSTAREKTPRIPLDGNQLFFERNTGKSGNYSNIWIADKKQNSWGNVRAAPKPLNNKGYNFVASSAGNGTVLLLGNVYDSLSGNSGKGVSISFKTNGGWTFPKKQHISNFYNQNEYCDYFLSYDLQRLYMALERKDSYGGLDIYVSRRTGPNHWSEPRNIGSRINSKHDEVFPFLASDNTTLYFSSNRPGGKGAMDIYLTRKKSNDGQNWSEPENLGPTINSHRNELGFYMAANKTEGYLYSWLNDSLKSVIIKGTLPPKLQPERVNMFRGKILDKKTNNPLYAKVKILNTKGSNGMFYSDPVKGSFIIPVKQQDSLLLEISRDGYLSKIVSVDSSYLYKNHRTYRNINLTPVNQKQVHQTTSVSFKGNSTSIPGNSFSALESAITYTESSPDLYLLIKTSQKDQLATKRMERLKEFIIANGIHSSRILTFFHENEIQDKNRFIIKICHNQN